jgi:hypothetical protein
MEKVTKTQNRKIYLAFYPSTQTKRPFGRQLQTKMLSRLEAKISFFDPSQKVYAVV